VIILATVCIILQTRVHSDARIRVSNPCRELLPAAERVFPVFSREYMFSESRPSLGLIPCLLLWIGLLVYGLWPFDFFLRNKVLWVDTGSGIVFDHYGQVYSVGR